MLAAARHRFNVTEYRRMAEAGIFRRDAYVELLNGEVFDMPPITPFRSGVIGRLTRLFTVISKDRWLVWPRNALCLDDQSQVQPDLCLLEPATDDYTSRHPRGEDVLLLIEVSETAAAGELQQRLGAYARAKVPEVWIANLADSAIEVYREPKPVGYGPKIVLRDGAQACPAAFPDAAIDVAHLLARDLKGKSDAGQRTQTRFSPLNPQPSVPSPQPPAPAPDRQHAQPVTASTTHFQERTPTDSLSITQLQERQRAQMASASAALLQRHREEVEKTSEIEVK